MRVTIKPAPTSNELEKRSENFITDGLAKTFSLFHHIHFGFGIVVRSFPLINTYHVQTNDGSGVLICGALSRGGTGLIGVQEIISYPPNTPVFYVKDSFSKYGYIIGSVPIPHTNGAECYNDVISPLSEVGMLWIPAYQSVFKGEAKTLPDFSGKTPEDFTDTGELCLISETGISLFIDRFMAALRVDEMTGLFMFLMDKLTRLTGWNLEIWSSVHQQENYDNLGRAVHYEGYAYTSRLNSGLGLNANVGNISFKKIPHHFDFEYRGYLGQGQRQIIQPIRIDSVEYGEKSVDDKSGALSEIFRSQYGIVGIRSATGIHLVKNPCSYIPYRKKPIWTNEKTNYKSPHANPLLVPKRAVDRVQTIHDLHVHVFGVLTHQGFLDLPDQFGIIRSNPGSFQKTKIPDNSAPPTTSPSVKLKAGPTQDVPVYLNSSMLSLNDNGTVILADGQGAAIKMINGILYLEGVDIVLTAPRNVISFAGRDCVLKSGRDLEATTTDGDIRIKAEKNMSLLAANAGGSYGMLLQSNSTVKMRDDVGFKQGHEARYPGISIFAPKSSINSRAESMVFDGHDEVALNAPEGIVIMAGEKVVSAATCAVMHVFHDSINTKSYKSLSNSKSSGSSSTSSGSNSENTSVNVFVNGATSLGGELFVARDAFVAKNVVIGDAAIMCNIPVVASDAAKSIIENYMSDNIMSDTSEVDMYLNEMEQRKKGWNNVYFSFCTDAQYKTAGFILPEPRWMTVCTGYTSWTENPVTRDKTKFYPFPGNVFYDKNNDCIIAAEHTISSELGEFTATISTSTKADIKTKFKKLSALGRMKG